MQEIAFNLWGGVLGSGLWTLLGAQTQTQSLSIFSSTPATSAQSYGAWMKACSTIIPHSGVLVGWSSPLLRP